MQFCWQYALERGLKYLRAKCGNKCKIEASIAEAYLNEEVSNFTTKYYYVNIRTVHNPLLRYNAANAEGLPKLSLFIGLGGKASGTKTKKLDRPEWEAIHSYVLTNMPEVKPYIK